MADPVITNNDLGSVIVDNERYQDDIFTAAGADTFLEGTILARDSVSLKLVVYVKGGVTNENGIPKAVLTKQLVTAGAGDSAIRVLVSGNVRKERLVIHADGTDANIDDAVKDQLRDYKILAESVAELNILDNA